MWGLSRQYHRPNKWRTGKPDIDGDVNFNFPLASLENPLLLGVRQLSESPARSTKCAFIFYVCFVSSSMSWSTKDSGLVPECIFDRPSVPLLMAYAQSKYTSERNLDQAAKVAGLRTIIYGVDQVAGPVSKGGLWGKRESLPY